MGKHHYIDPQRSSNCVEYGLIRKWSLPVLAGREMVEFCSQAFGEIVEVISAAHEWCRAEYEQEITCAEDKSYRVLRESAVFPGIERAWGDGAMDRVLAAVEELPLRVYPFDESRALHTIKGEKFARGWVSFKESSYWPERYISMLIYSVGGRRLRFKNSVFFDRRLARVFREKPVGRGWMD